jgi:hypothetical protein
MSDVGDCLSPSLLPKFVLIFVLFCLMLVVVNEADVAGAVVSFVEVGGIIFVIVNDDAIVFSFVAVIVIVFVNEDGFVIIDVIDPFVVNDASVLAFVAFVVVDVDVDVDDVFVDIVVPFLVVESDDVFIVALGSDILFNETLNLLHLKNSCLTKVFFCSLFFVELIAAS